MHSAGNTITDGVVVEEVPGREPARGVRPAPLAKPSGFDQWTKSSEPWTLPIDDSALDEVVTPITV